VTVAHQPECIECGRYPEDIIEYIDAVKGTGLTPSQYVRQEEGTYNPANGHYACTSCYIKLGMPVASDGGRWKAP